MQRRQTNEAIYNCTLIILALVAIVHVLRVFLGWSVTVNGSDIPMWVSVIALVVAAGLAFWALARECLVELYSSAATELPLSER